MAQTKEEYEASLEAAKQEAFRRRKSHHAPGPERCPVVDYFTNEQCTGFKGHGVFPALGMGHKHSSTTGMRRLWKRVDELERLLEGYIEPMSFVMEALACITMPHKNAADAGKYAADRIKALQQIAWTAHECLEDEGCWLDPVNDVGESLGRTPRLLEEACLDCRAYYDRMYREE